MNQNNLIILERVNELFNPLQFIQIHYADRCICEIFIDDVDYILKVQDSYYLINGDTLFDDFIRYYRLIFVSGMFENPEHQQITNIKAQDIFGKTFNRLYELSSLYSIKVEV
jgi:hypothetical protein